MLVQSRLASRLFIEGIRERGVRDTLQPRLKMKESEDDTEPGAKVKHIQSLLKELKQVLEDIKDETSQSSQLQKSQVLLCNAHATLALGALLYKLEGCDELTDVMLKSELLMVSAYKQKVQKAVAKEELRTQKKKTEINIDAMHRFIEHAIPDLDEAQKAGLKRVADTAAEARDGQASRSLLATEDADPFATVTATKGKSATERTKRRKLAKSNDTSAKLLDDLLSNMPDQDTGA